MEPKKNLTTEQLDDAAKLKALYESKKKELGVTQYTIADELGIAVETVKKQKQIARRILKEKLGNLFTLFFAMW